jgi:hypothetical protein
VEGCTVNPVVTVLIMLAFQGMMAGNMLTNGDARDGTFGWTTEDVFHGVAKTEVVNGVPCFTLPSPNSFQQVVAVPPSAAGSYAALVGRGQADRVNSNGSITGLPYLYRMVIAADRIHFLGYWQGQQMLARPAYPGEWVAMSGVFRVPSGAAAISVQL